MRELQVLVAPKPQQGVLVRGHAGLVVKKLSEGIAPGGADFVSGGHISSLGFGVQGAGFRIQGSGFRVQGSGFRVQGSGIRVQGAGFRV